MRAADLPTPDPEALERAREERLKEIAMEAILKECIVYFFFILVLFFLSYQVRDADSYRFADNIKNHFWALQYDKVPLHDCKLPVAPVRNAVTCGEPVIMTMLWQVALLS